MAHPATIALNNSARWVGNSFCIPVVLVMLGYKYGFEKGTLWLLGMGAIAALLLLLRPIRRLFYPTLVTMVAAGLFSVVGLAIDRATGGSVFAFKTSHFGGFFFGATLVETRVHDGSTLHIFKDGFTDTWYYASRSDRAWFPQVSLLPDTWRRGDPLPTDMSWETATH
jgi:hypothetical protein